MTDPIALKFYSLVPNNIGQNVSHGLNVVTCEQTSVIVVVNFIDLLDHSMKALRPRHYTDRTRYPETVPNCFLKTILHNLLRPRN